MTLKELIENLNGIKIYMERTQKYILKNIIESMEYMIGPNLILVLILWRLQ
jgi:hypothetical protein